MSEDFSDPYNCLLTVVSLSQLTAINENCEQFIHLLKFLSVTSVWEVKFEYQIFTRRLSSKFCIVYRASLHDLFQMKPTRCILLLSVFISTFLHVSGNYLPTIRRTCCIYATLVFFPLYGWLSGLLVGMRLQPADQVTTHTEQKKSFS